MLNEGITSVFCDCFRRLHPPDVSFHWEDPVVCWTLSLLGIDLCSLHIVGHCGSPHFPHLLFLCVWGKVRFGFVVTYCHVCALPVEGSVNLYDMREHKPWYNFRCTISLRFYFRSVWAVTCHLYLQSCIFYLHINIKSSRAFNPF